jgi:hypothetical protein
MRITITILLCIVASAIAFSPANNVVGNSYSRAAAKGKETSSFSTKLLMGGPNDTPIGPEKKYTESYMRKLRSNALAAKLAAKEESERARAIANAQTLSWSKQQIPAPTTDKRFLGNLGQGIGDAAKGLVGVTVTVGKGVVVATKGLVGVTFATVLFTGKIGLRILIPWLGIEDV